MLLQSKNIVYATFSTPDKLTLWLKSTFFEKKSLAPHSGAVGPPFEKLKKKLIKTFEAKKRARLVGILEH